MERWIIYTDTHWNGPTPSPMFTNKDLGKNTAFTGDIFEFKNIPKRSIDSCLSQFIKFLNKIEASGSVYVNGNHEVEVGRIYWGKRKEKREHILFEHGDQDGYENWYTRTAGKGKWAIRAIKFKNLFRNGRGPKKLSVKFMDEAARRAKYAGCTTYVCGHKHPKNIIDVTHKGIRIVCCPRGRSEVNL